MRSVSKTDILAHVWDDDFEGDPNIVKVYICDLRNKGRPAVRRAAIETIRVPETGSTPRGGERMSRWWSGGLDDSDVDPGPETAMRGPARRRHCSSELLLLGEASMRSGAH